MNPDDAREEADVVADAAEQTQAPAEPPQPSLMERLKKKLERLRADDSNIYPLF